MCVDTGRASGGLNGSNPGSPTVGRWRLARHLGPCLVKELWDWVRRVWSDSNLLARWLLEGHLDSCFSIR